MVRGIFWYAHALVMLTQRHPQCRGTPNFHLHRLFPPLRASCTEVRNERQAVEWLWS
ncbi:hypothetical protein Pan258_09260 [Symmachiella dynata]|nr:hypothetical protein Pan258_09260 [Symmachiella dynata]